MTQRKKPTDGQKPARLLSGRQAARSSIIAVVLVTLAACAPVPQRPAVVGTEALQAAREAALAQSPGWTFSGRLAVSQQGKGGNASIHWSQQGEDFRIQLSAPITRQGWRLEQTDGRVTLAGLDGGLREGTDAEAMLQSATGWRIPLQAMSSWVRGARSTGPADIGFDAHGLPATLVQDGWAVEYRGWTTGTPPLPEKIFASQGTASVRLVIEHWNAP